ncbi:hypothetical protein ABPG75_009037 [Micractinium tetrahymenae]
MTTPPQHTAPVDECVEQSWPYFRRPHRQRLKEAVAKGAGKPNEEEAGGGGQGAGPPASAADAGEGQHIWEREGQEAQMPPPGEHVEGAKGPEFEESWPNPNEPE